jgi:hypothetical protein
MARTLSGMPRTFGWQWQLHRHTVTMARAQTVHWSMLDHHVSVGAWTTNASASLVERHGGLRSHHLPVCGQVH